MLQRSNQTNDTAKPVRHLLRHCPAVCGNYAKFFVAYVYFYRKGVNFD